MIVELDEIYLAKTVKGRSFTETFLFLFAYLLSFVMFAIA